jgi:hypothetical protein
MQRFLVLKQVVTIVITVFKTLKLVFQYHSRSLYNWHFMNSEMSCYLLVTLIIFNEG